MAFKLNLPTLKGQRKVRGKNAISFADRPLPLIGHLPFSKQFQFLGAATVLTLLVGIVAGVLDFRATTNGTRYLQLSDDLVFLTQRLAKDAASALQGEQSAVESLPVARAEAENILSVLDNGDDSLPPTSGAPRAPLDALLPVARKALQNIDAIDAGRPAILTVSRAVDVVNELGPLMREAIAQLPAAGVDNQRVTKYALLMERIGADVNAMLGGVVTTQQIGALGSDMLEAEDLLSKFGASNPAVAKVVDYSQSYQSSVESVISQAQGLLGAKQAAAEYLASVSQDEHGLFLSNARALSDAYRRIAFRPLDQLCCFDRICAVTAVSGIVCQGLPGRFPASRKDG